MLWFFLYVGCVLIFAFSAGNKVRREKKLREEGNFKGSGSISGLAIDTRPSVQRKGDADPGVISDDDEFAVSTLFSFSVLIIMVISL